MLQKRTPPNVHAGQVPRIDRLLDELVHLSLHPERDAFLVRQAPHLPPDAVHHAVRVQLDGVVLALPGKPKTFYVDGKCAATVNLRERYAPF